VVGRLNEVWRWWDMVGGSGTWWDVVGHSGRMKDG